MASFDFCEGPYGFSFESSLIFFVAGFNDLKNSSSARLTGDAMSLDEIPIPAVTVNADLNHSRRVSSIARVIFWKVGIRRNWRKSSAR